jgi:hypothetical protein
VKMSAGLPRSAPTGLREEDTMHTEDLYVLAFATMFAILVIGFASMFHS